MFDMVIITIGENLTTPTINSVISKMSPGKYPDNIAVYIGISWIPIAGLLTFIEYKIHPEKVRKAATMSIEDEAWGPK